MIKFYLLSTSFWLVLCASPTVTRSLSHWMRQVRAHLFLEIVLYKYFRPPDSSNAVRVELLASNGFGRVCWTSPSYFWIASKILLVVLVRHLRPDSSFESETGRTQRSRPANRGVFSQFWRVSNWNFQSNSDSNSSSDLWPVANQKMSKVATLTKPPTLNGTKLQMLFSLFTSFSTFLNFHHSFANFSQREALRRRVFVLDTCIWTRWNLKARTYKFQLRTGIISVNFKSFELLACPWAYQSGRLFFSAIFSSSRSCSGRSGLSLSL